MTHSVSKIRFVLPFVVLSSLAACAGEKPAQPVFRRAPVILISIDTLRADHLPIYGYKGVATPNIDQLAADGITFDHAYSPCPMTLPSHVTMLTGLTPLEHGVRNNLGFPFDSSAHDSLPRRLKNSGYATGAAVSTYVLRGETGMRDVFDWYEGAIDPRPGAAFDEYQRSGKTTAEMAVRWLDTVRAQPFFLMLHLYEPHVPYAPPEPFRSRYVNQYDGEIATSDAIVGEFLEELKRRGLYDRSIIILTSDHGEGLGDHGEDQHSILIYTEAIRVPLVVKLPGAVRRGARLTTPAALVDIAPTVAALLGETAPRTSGVDLFADGQTRRDIYSESIYPYVQLGWSDLRSLINDRFHYIESPRPELYDIRRDPAEKQNVIQEQRREAARMREALAELPRGDMTVATVDPEVAAKLAALGYVGSVKRPADSRVRPNPVEHVRVMTAIRDAFQLADEHRYREAIDAMRTILATNPGLFDVWTRLAEVYLDTGEIDRSIDAYKKAIAVSGVAPSETLLALGRLYLQAGRLDDAAAAAELAMPESPDGGRSLQARVAMARGDLATADRIARLLSARPDALPSDVLLMAEVQRARGDFAGALATLDQAGATFGLHLLRAEILIQLDRHEDAMKAFEQEIGLYPANRRAYSRLAVLYYVMGRRRATLETLDRLVNTDPSPAAYALAANTLEALNEPEAATRFRQRSQTKKPRPSGRG